VWGAVIGTLPDLDVLVPLGDAVSDFTYHRSVSHSLFVLALVTPLLTWLICKIHPPERVRWRRWLLMVYLVFATHVMLDSFTAYGTQILWPLDDTPVFWSTIFIIDPLYTLPLLVGVIAALVASRDRDRGHRWNRAGLVVSTLYLSWTVAASHLAEHRFESALRAQDIEHELLYVSPAPFTSFAWRAVAIDRRGYYEAWYSVFDRAGPIRFTHYPSQRELLQDIEDHWAVRRLQWFSHGVYAVTQIGRDIVIGDLRMGIEPNYVFRFKVGELGSDGVRPAFPRQLDPVRDMGRLPQLWRRIWDEAVVLSPPPASRL
jgi:inner membrane protein